MKQKTLFRGIATALATPMTSSGAIDYDAYGRLIDWHLLRRRRQTASARRLFRCSLRRCLR